MIAPRICLIRLGPSVTKAHGLPRVLPSYSGSSRIQSRKFGTRTIDLDIKAAELVRADITHKFCQLGSGDPEGAEEITEMVQLQNDIEEVLKRLRSSNIPFGGSPRAR